MKFKIKYNFKGGMNFNTSSSSTSSSTSSSSVPEENNNIIVMLFPKNQTDELVLRRKTITNFNTGQLNYNSNLFIQKEHYRKFKRYGWIYESEIDNFPQFKNKYLLPYKIFISFNIPINDDLMNRWNICKRTSNQCEIQSPHITLARLEIYDHNNLTKLLRKKDLIRHELKNFLLDIDNSTSRYKILGTKKGDVPLDIKNTLFTYENKDILQKLKVENDETECYLSRVFYMQEDKDVIGNKDSIGIKGENDKQVKSKEIKHIGFLYNLIHFDLDKDSFSDYDYYKQVDYEKFIIHLSLAKFKNINDALSALENIYTANLRPGFNDIFTNPHYFNIQIS